MKDNGLDDNKRFWGKITIAFDSILILTSVVMMALRGLESLEPVYAFNIGADFICMLIGLLLMLFCYVDLQRTGAGDRYYRYLVEVTFIGLFTDLAAWIMMGKGEFRVLLWLVNTVFFMVMPLLVFWFWRYVVHIIGKDDPLVRSLEQWIVIGLLVEMLFCTFNLFGGFFFSIDANGVYERGMLHPLHMMYIVFVGGMGALLIILRRKKLTKRQIIAIAAYLLTPFPVVVMSFFIYGISINYVMCMVDMMLMYGILNVEQGREWMAAEQELATATSIQTGVLPHVFPLFPDCKEFDVYASMDPAKEVGGDLYDAFLIDDDHLALVVGDVSGKGVPAALFMVIAKTLIKNRAQMGGTPAEILMDVNPRLYEGNTAKMFVTVWLGILTLSTGQVTEVNAGHEHPAIRHRGSGFELLERKHGFVCGGMKKVKYTDDDFELAPGDMLFVYTDGVPEATNSNGERYGMERMVAALSSYEGEDPKELLGTVRADIDTFVGEAPQFDDLTMLAVRYDGKK